MEKDKVDNHGQNRRQNVLDGVGSIEFDKNESRIFGIKSGIVWAHSSRATTFPLLYISKPRDMSEDDFRYLLDRVEIQICKNKIR